MHVYLFSIANYLNCVNFWTNTYTHHLKGTLIGYISQKIGRAGKPLCTIDWLLSKSGDFYAIHFTK